MTGASLCAECGLCCDDTFFTQITLRSDEEVARVERRGLVVLQKAGRSVLPMPCPQHSGTACRIYEDRPQACADFRCWLLRDVESEMIDFNDAVAIIARLKVLAETIQGAFSLDVRGQALFDAAAAFFEKNNTLEARREHAELFLDMAEFLQIARRRFGIQTDDPPAESSPI